MLDMKTVMFSYVITNILITVFIAFLWHENRKRYAGLSYWLADYVLQALGLLLLLLRDIAPDFISIVSGNSLAILGIIFMLMGLERFVGKARRQTHNYLLLIGFVLSISYFTFLQPDISIRTILITAAVFLLTGQCAWLMLYRVDAPLKPITQAVGVVFFLYALVSLARIVSLLLIPLPARSPFFQSPLSHLLFLVSYQVLTIALTFALMLMVTRRLRNEIDEHVDHYRRAAEQLRARDEELRESEERDRTILESIEEAYFEVDLTGNFTFCNEALCKSLGYSYSEVMGMNNRDYMSPESAKKIYNLFNQIYKAGNPIKKVSYEIMRKDGSRGFHELYASLMKNQAGRPIGFRGISHDITEFKKAEDALRESEEKYRLIAENMADVITVMDMNLRFTYVSPSVKRIRGFTVEEAMEQTLEQVMTPESLEIVSKVFEEEMQLEAMGKGDTNRTRILEFEGYRKDGSTAWLENSLSFVRDEDQRPVGILAVTRDITERRRAEKELLESEKRFRLTFQTSPDPINLNRVEDGIYIDINEAFTKVMGYTREEVIGNPSLPVEIWKNPEDRKRLVDGLTKTGYVENMEAQFVGKDGKIRYGLISARVARISGENVIISISRDITERKRAEEERDELQAQLSQAQKMESVGRLAGGVAHDLNNSLQPILGYADLALMELDKSEPLYGDMKEIHKAAIRSTNIVRQLLAFARKQSIAPVVLDLNDTMEGMLKMLRRLIGEDIELAWMPGAGLWPVRMDPSQVDQILANLVVNARDAIAGVGKVRIETRNAELDEDYCRSHAGAVAARYVLLAVGDSGSGMDKGVLGQLFEPFFTTKEVGKGTGLGLATVYGIVRQNNGWIDVESEPGKGSTFRIYLPGYEGEKEETQEPSPSAAHLTGTETVLLVEDQKAVLDLGRRLLTRLGYRVLTAGTPGEAMRLAEEHEGEIRLLMTDVVMPEMNGRDLAEKLRASCPDIKTLFMSGYTADVIAHHGVLEQGVHFIQKPFSMKDMACRVRSALET